ncbi:Efflux pump DEP3 [Fusarium oxysporum f. sp. rapae]|uniref:Efflux pump DEP3 n=1 Tax=Fusarium oxysporum f. sp. rapae TaxID=485398 RepID=A0A8J5TN71_FUSOX|nr:Efflux pump DEP3 [Fusarium oxysporum f. sp. rapae]
MTRIPCSSYSQPPQPQAGIGLGTILTIYITCIINGFDVSNVANIQPQLYEAFGHIEFLPWIGLSYSLANFATLAFARKIIDVFNIRYVYIISIAIFFVGATLAGVAGNISTVIAGRAIMGIGGSICQNCAISYFAMYATDSQSPLLYGIMSGLWAIGLVVGGPGGSAFVQSSATTWRWAFFINLPFLGLAIICALIFVPGRPESNNLPLRDRLADIDILGIVLQLATTVLFAIAATFSGSVWEWGSAPCIAIWTTFAIVFAAWVVQQLRSYQKRPGHQVVPITIMARRHMIPLWVASGCAGATYAIMLYYMPLFYAFSKGLGALQQTVRLLPFILPFIVTVIIITACLPRVNHYGLIYLAGGAITLGSAIALATTLAPNVSESKVMGLTALVGVGLGLHFQHSNAISNRIHKDLRDRMEGAALLNMSLMGGISMALIIAGAVYENRGMSLLKSALGSFDYDEGDLREALAGVSRDTGGGDEAHSMIANGANATCKAIALLFYIVASSGALCLACGVLAVFGRSRAKKLQ